jgi:hypothetical protein
MEGFCGMRGVLFEDYCFLLLASCFLLLVTLLITYFFCPIIIPLSPSPVYMYMPWVSICDLQLLALGEVKPVPVGAGSLSRA